MHTLIDTNIYLTDLTLNRPEYEALANYLRTSHSLLLIPNVVHREIQKNISSIAEAEASKISRLYSTKLGTISNTPDRATIEEALTKHFDRAIKKFRRAEIGYDGDILEELIERSLVEKPPFKSKGRGFRDALIWHTLLKRLKDDPKSSIAFITNNSEDFGAETMKPELLEELRTLGYQERVFYFNSLNDFLIKHSEPITFIDEAFIERVLDPDSWGEDYADEGELDIDFPSREFDWTITDITYEDYEIEGYYIYRTTDSHYYVSVEVTYNYYVELDGYGMVWGFDHMSGDIDWHHESVSDTTNATKSKEFTLKINKKTRKVDELGE